MHPRRRELLGRPGTGCIRNGSRPSISEAALFKVNLHARRGAVPAVHILPRLIFGLRNLFGAATWILHRWIANAALFFAWGAPTEEELRRTALPTTKSAVKQKADYNFYESYESVMFKKRALFSWWKLGGYSSFTCFDGGGDPPGETVEAKIRSKS